MALSVKRPISGETDLWQRDHGRAGRGGTMTTNTLPNAADYGKMFFGSSFLVVLFVSGSISGVDLARFFSNSSQMNVILQKMAHPDWAYAKIIVEPILQTIKWRSSAQPLVHWRPFRFHF